MIKKIKTVGVEFSEGSQSSPEGYVLRKLSMFFFLQKMKFEISKFLELPQNDPEDYKVKCAPHVAYLTRPKFLSVSLYDQPFPIYPKRFISLVG